MKRMCVSLNPAFDCLGGVLFSCFFVQVPKPKTGFYDVLCGYINIYRVIHIYRKELVEIIDWKR